MKKHAPLIAVMMIAASILVLPACKNKSSEKKAADNIQEIVDKAPGINAGTGTFQITPPANWEKIDTTVGGLKLTYLFEPLKPGMTFRTNIVVVTEAMNSTSMDDYFNRNRQTMSRMMQGFKEKGIGKEEINGQEVNWMEYSHTPAGQEVDVKVYVFSKNKIAYVVTCTSPKGEQGKYEKEFKEALNSMKI